MATGRNRKASYLPKQHFPTPLAERWRQSNKRLKLTLRLHFDWVQTLKTWCDHVLLNVDNGVVFFPKQLRAAKLLCSNYLIVPLLLTGLDLYGLFGTDCGGDPRDTFGGAHIDQIARRRPICLVTPDLSLLSLAFPSALCISRWFARSRYQFLLLQLSSVQQSFPVGD